MLTCRLLCALSLALLVDQQGTAKDLSRFYEAKETLCLRLLVLKRKHGQWVVFSIREINNCLGCYCSLCSATWGFCTNPLIAVREAPSLSQTGCNAYSYSPWAVITLSHIRDANWWVSHFVTCVHMAPIGIYCAESVKLTQVLIHGESGNVLLCTWIFE